MPFVEHNDMVDTLASYGTDDPFNVRRRLRHQLHPMAPICRDLFSSRIPFIHLADASLSWSRSVRIGARTASTSITMIVVPGYSIRADIAPSNGG